jgi:hypothetical protein
MNRRTMRRVRQIGARMAELSVGEVTADVVAEVTALNDELTGLRGGPAPKAPPELPAPGSGSFTMKPKRAETEGDRWRKLIAMRQGTPMMRTVYDPEATAARAARIEQRKENVTGLLPRSAMRAGAPVSRETRRR